MKKIMLLNRNKNYENEHTARGAMSVSAAAVRWMEQLRVRWHFITWTVLFFSVGQIHAQGSLGPRSAPAPSMHTLDQIYQAVTTSGGVLPIAEGGSFVALPPTAYPQLPNGATDAALYLKLNGDDIAGDNPNSSLGRSNSIFVMAYAGSISRPAAGGAVTIAPISILKPIDRSTPLLIRGVALNHPAQGQIRFFRENPVGDGTTEHFYTVRFTDGRIIRHEQAMPGYELMIIKFGTIEWTFVSGGVTFSYTVP